MEKESKAEERSGSGSRLISLTPRTDDEDLSHFLDADRHGALPRSVARQPKMAIMGSLNVFRVQRQCLHAFPTSSRKKL